MTKDKALDLALEALETELAVDMTNGAEVGEAAELMCEAITAIKQARSAPVQEPFGYVWFTKHMEHRFTRMIPHPDMGAMNIKPIYTAPPAQTAPVQEPVAWMYEVNGAHTILDLFEPPDDAYDEGTLHPLYTTPPAAPYRAVKTVHEGKPVYVSEPAAPVQDAEGENKAVRCFLMLYGQAGLTVGQMRKHMAMSGFKSWPTWVETEHDGAHLTKAGAQLWIRHLFSLETK